METRSVASSVQALQHMNIHIIMVVEGHPSFLAISEGQQELNLAYDHNSA